MHEPQKTQAETRRASSHQPPSFPWKRVPCGGRSRVGVSSPHSPIIAFGCVAGTQPLCFSPTGTHPSRVTSLQAGAQGPGGTLTLTSRTQAPSASKGQQQSLLQTGGGGRQRPKGHGPSLPGGPVAGQLFPQCPTQRTSADETLARAWSGAPSTPGEPGNGVFRLARCSPEQKLAPVSQGSGRGRTRCRVG